MTPKVVLLAHTPTPEQTVAAAARLCYSDTDVEALRESISQERAEQFVEMLDGFGHESPVEHVTFTFGIEGVSRSFLAQVTRHRIASYSVQSQRYVRQDPFVYITPPAIAGKLDVYKILRFVRSEAFRRICGAEDVLRELAFITSLPAAEVMAAQGRALPDGPAADAGVLVQGIADIVLIYPDHLELLDYKTDRRKTPADFVRAYRAQLELYAKAIEKRFAPRRVTYKGIYSLELGELIQV